MLLWHTVPQGKIETAKQSVETVCLLNKLQDTGPTWEKRVDLMSQGFISFAVVHKVMGSLVFLPADTERGEC